MGRRTPRVRAIGVQINMGHPEGEESSKRNPICYIYSDRDDVKWFIQRLTLWLQRRGFWDQVQGIEQHPVRRRKDRVQSASLALRGFQVYLLGNQPQWI